MDVMDIDITHDEWMKLNAIIERIESDVEEDVPVPNTAKPETLPSVLYVPLPIPIPMTHIHHVPLFIPIPYCIPQQSSASISPPTPKPIDKRNIYEYVRKSDKGCKALQKRNRKRKNGERCIDKISAIQTAKSDAKDRVTDLKPLPNIRAEGMHKLSNVIVGGNADGNVPKTSRNRNNGERGPDRKKRRQRRCGRCLLNKGKQHPFHMPDNVEKICKGRGRTRDDCEYWNADDTVKVVPSMHIFDCNTNTK